MSKTFIQVVIVRLCFFDAEGYRYIGVKINEQKRSIDEEDSKG